MRNLCRLLIVLEAAIALALLGCVSAPTQNKYCDNMSWFCGDPAAPVCLTTINTCVPVGWTCYDNDGTLAHYPDPTNQGDPNFSHCGPVMDAGAPDMTALPDLAPPPPDLAPPPDMTPDVHFKPDIQRDLDFLGCSAAGCHAVSSGLYAPLLQASPGSVAEMQNYTNFMADAVNGTLSLFLTKPLTGSGVTHAGGAPGSKPFASTADPTYQRWVLWLNEGARY